MAFKKSHNFNIKISQLLRLHVVMSEVENYKKVSKSERNNTYV